MSADMDFGAQSFDHVRAVQLEGGAFGADAGQPGPYTSVIVAGR